MRMRRHGHVLVLNLLIVTAAACGGDDGPTPGADAGPALDGSPGPDGSPGLDAGPGVDSGPGRDAGPSVDAGPGTDSGPGLDAGPAVDAGPPPPCSPPVLPALATEEVAPGHTFSAPIFLTQAPGSTDTLWVVEQRGVIRLVRGGAVVGDFLDIRSRVDFRGERGLLGLAFHPDYATNGRFFIYYNPDGANLDVVAEYRVTSDPDVADPTEVARLVAQDSLESNHNGGMLAFSPRDELLYVGLGDGGGGGDAHGAIGNGLDRNTLLGKILRLDPDNAAGDYAAAGNPFSSPDGLPQIWAYGLRNPWRFSFDRMTDDLYIADVGQNRWEEIDIQPASSTGGENYGWRAYEGLTVFRMADVDEVPVHSEPVVVVEHGSDPILRSACSITGGYVYRGAAIPALRGVYLFGDYCSRDVAAFRWCEGSVMGLQRAADLEISDARGGLAAFGEDNAGEVYMLNVRGGSVLRIIPG